MINHELKQQIVRSVLSKVRMPGQYVGGERNIVVKDHGEVAGKLCLCFPDAYTIGMSHHGLQVLYSLMNRPRRLGRRTLLYALAGHGATVAAAADLPLYSLETFTPLQPFRCGWLFLAVRDIVAQRADHARLGRHSLAGQSAHDGRSA